MPHIAITVKVDAGQNLEEDILSRAQKKHGTGGRRMADLIDRDALLNDLKESIKSAREWREEAHDEEIKIRAEQAHGTFVECALRIKHAPAVNRWIPCSERLPEVYEKVLTYSDDGIIHDNFRLNLRDGSVGWSQGWGITHWQPRPEPPEMER